MSVFGKVISIGVLLFFIGCSPKNELQKTNIESHISQQLFFAIDHVEPRLNGEEKLVAPRTIEDGKLKMVPSRDWTSGFFAGELWYMYELTKDSVWFKKARRYTDLLEDQQWNGRTHDMGFKMYCSYGNGYRLTKDTSYRSILLQSANTLITRYSDRVGCIRSWDHNDDKWNFPVIIDNMMNLELLFWATKETGDSTYYKIAVSHALTTLKNHFRDDNSSYHVVDYDPETGEVVSKTTHQGYAPESAWSRGQGWGLYGYTMLYRETKREEFLQQAEKIAQFIMHHPNLPKDMVPYWDFNAPDIPNEPRDASAASVMASAFYELAGYSVHSEEYIKAANTMVESLSSEQYLAQVGSNEGFLLLHSTGSKPHDSEIDVPLVYADYYYLEAWHRKNKAN